jgi:hypothetical protein
MSIVQVRVDKSIEFLYDPLLTLSWELLFSCVYYVKLPVHFYPKTLALYFWKSLRKVSTLMATSHTSQEP